MPPIPEELDPATPADVPALPPPFDPAALDPAALPPVAPAEPVKPRGGAPLAQATSANAKNEGIKGLPYFFISFLSFLLYATSFSIGPSAQNFGLRKDVTLGSPMASQIVRSRRVGVPFGIITGLPGLEGPADMVFALESAPGRTA